MLSRYDPIRLQSDSAILAYFDAVAIVGIEALKSHFQVVFRLANRHAINDSRDSFTRTLITKFDPPKERRPSRPIAIRFIKSYRLQTQGAAQASQRFRASEKCRIR